MSHHLALKCFLTLFFQLEDCSQFAALPPPPAFTTAFQLQASFQCILPPSPPLPLTNIYFNRLRLHGVPKPACNWCNCLLHFSTESHIHAFLSPVLSCFHSFFRLSQTGICTCVGNPTYTLLEGVTQADCIGGSFSYF